jgi:hypothetical protein
VHTALRFIALGDEDAGADGPRGAVEILESFFEELAQLFVGAGLMARSQAASPAKLVTATW